MFTHATDTTKHNQKTARRVYMSPLNLSSGAAALYSDAAVLNGHQAAPRVMETKNDKKITHRRHTFRGNTGCRC